MPNLTLPPATQESFSANICALSAFWLFPILAANHLLVLLPQITGLHGECRMQVCPVFYIESQSS